MDSNQRANLAKKICQLFVNGKKCKSTRDVNALLRVTDSKTLLDFALKKGLKVSESDQKDLIHSIYLAKEFYGASPIGSQSCWKVNCSFD